MWINTKRCTFEMWINSGDILEQAFVELVNTQWNNSSYLVTQCQGGTSFRWFVLNLWHNSMVEDTLTCEGMGGTLWNKPYYNLLLVNNLPYWVHCSQVEKALPISLHKISWNYHSKNLTIIIIYGSTLMQSNWWWGNFGISHSRMCYCSMEWQLPLPHSLHS
jgi:hypothetical protein